MKKWFKKKVGNERGEGTVSDGANFTSLLAIVFIGLKLGKIISWSWWWVLSPLWIPLAIAIPLLLIFLIIS